MKRTIQALVMGCVASLLAFAVVADVQTLRGENPIDKAEQSFEQKKQVKQEGGFDRFHQKQPPLIPHGIDKEQITLKNNTCMKCHNEKNHEKEKAPKVGDSHFLDRDGKKLPDISMRRWFCDQCHAPQVDAKPLVENTL